MKRKDILEVLKANRDEISSRFGVSSLSLFGSVARNEATEKSDVDILVTFSETPGIFRFIELKSYLASLLQCSVDLVTQDALREQFREQIVKEAVNAV